MLGSKQKPERIAGKFLVYFMPDKAINHQTAIPTDPKKCEAYHKAMLN